VVVEGEMIGVRDGQNDDDKAICAVAGVAVFQGLLSLCKAVAAVYQDALWSGADGVVWGVAFLAAMLRSLKNRGANFCEPIDRVLFVIAGHGLNQ
jgi:hypothetical protein